MSHQFGTLGTGPGQFDGPEGVAFNTAGHLFVCDYGNSRIQIFRRDGPTSWLPVHEFGSLGSAPGEFEIPIAIAVSETNDIYIADFGNNRIQVFHLDGTFSCLGSEGTGPGQFQSPVGIAIYEDTIFVCDYLNHRIQCFHQDGTFVRMWGTYGSEPGQFDHPRALAVSSTGVYVCDRVNNRIQVFDHNGTFLRSWGGVEDILHHPQCIAVSEAGKVFVGEQNRMKVFRSEGTYDHQLELPDGDQGPFRPSGVAVAANGDVVICDIINARIHTINATAIA